ncbi:VWA domain-containing protein [Pseudoalteromonas pernae]|uniref:VWA domain-containing protein n=1 Tax=Pseudoalteromonas pernae TaxID=3118054 RepID=UPI003242B037
MSDFVFLRAPALYLLIPVAAYFIWRLFAKAAVVQQSQIIAPHLANQVMEGAHANKRQSLGLTNTILMTVIVFALAGPSFSKQEVPVFEAKLARVMVMDMSRSMFATDISPNRLQQARFKALDMVELFKEGETALVAYSGDAFTISPLTSDSNTLTNLIPSLSPEIMPSQGSNVLAGLVQAQELLEQAGYYEGDIILLTDGIDSEDETDVRNWLSKSPYNLSIYAIGSSQGAPISLPDGGFLKDSQGQIVIPKTNFDRLNRLAKLGGGQLIRYQPSSDNLEAFTDIKVTATQVESKSQQTLWRIDAGIYLAMVAAILLLVQIHRNAIMLCAALVLIPWQSAHAATWQSWFKNEQQNALDAYQQQEYAQAATSGNALLSGSAKYQQQDYQGALEEFNKDSSATGLYNQGNALAQLGKVDEALERYQQALDKDPNLSAAAANKAILEQLKNQQQNQQQSDDQNQQQEESEQQNSEQQQGDNQQQSTQQQQDSQQQNSGSEGENQRNDSQQNNPQNSADPQQQDSAEQSADPAQEKQSEQADEQPNKDSKKQFQEGKESQERADEESAQQSQENSDEQADKGKQQQQAVAQAQQVEELTAEEKERAQQLNQLLRKIPDDPEILLRNKMQLEAQQRQHSSRRLPQGVDKSW